MDVIVAGAGPTGLMLAGELALGGARVVVVEQRAERLEQVKGGAVQPRTAELLDTRGLLEPLRAHALPREAGGHFGLLPVPLDCTPWNTRQPHPISVPQWRVEEVLAAGAARLGVRMLRGLPVHAVEPDDTGVTVRAGDRTLRAGFLVACDGAHSAVRKLLDLPFPGRPGTYRAVLTDVELTAVSADVPVRLDHISTHTRQRGGYWGMLVPVGDRRYRFTYGRIADTDADGTDAADTDAADTDAADTDAAAVQAALTALYGEPTELGAVLNASHFSDATRQLEHYRHGRVLFAGDAAHIHPPLGGQGLNLGVQDAMNLGWKLAATVAGWAPRDLLDTYQAERHPVAARVLHHTAAQRVLANPLAEPDVVALREIVTDLLRLPDTNRYLAGMMSGLDAEGRVPDVELVTGNGTTRPAELLRTGRGLLLDLTGSADLPAGWADRVDLVRAKSDVDLGTLLIRPDATTAWSGTDATSLTAALTATFGAPF